MAREILFRAKRIDNGEWEEGYYFKAREHWHEHGVHEDWLVVNAIQNGGWCNVFKKHAIDKNTICQYTGLTDKNGNKIWENDMLSDDDMFSVVRWDEEEARFVIDDYGTKGCLMEYGFDECMGEYGVVDTYGFDDFYSMKSFEVIGNKFDNPELLDR